MKRILLTAILAVSALQVADVNAANGRNSGHKRTNSEATSTDRELTQIMALGNSSRDRAAKASFLQANGFPTATGSMKGNVLDGMLAQLQARVNVDEESDAALVQLKNKFFFDTLALQQAHQTSFASAQTAEENRLAQEAMLRTNAFQRGEVENSEAMRRAAQEEAFLAEFTADLNQLSLSPDYVESKRNAVQAQVDFTKAQENQAADALRRALEELAKAEEDHRIAEKNASLAADKKQQYTNDWAVDAYASPEDRELKRTQKALAAAQEALATAQRNPLLRAWSWCTGFFRK